MANIDWPSKPGLPPAQQRKELLALLDKAEQLNLNAVILQVRPACDALYASNLEPWSEYLNGKMGSRPEPFYDPLAFAVEQAHQRGLELHAWINPFRARHTSAKSAVAPNHVSRTHPQWVRSYGKLLWLDPGEKAAQEYSIAVILDVVKRYDVDGLHVDDYFYPYQEKTPNGKAINFPDDLTWKAYLANGGKLSRNDWRRKNVDDFIQRLYGRIKSERPWVKFGISPFGIWRPGHPPQITGLDAYEELYADSRKWLNNGWCDYFAPQLYWPIQSAGQSYPVLLHWWSSQNATRRHLWPGSNSSKVGHGWQKEEIMNQIRLARKEPGVTGHIHWHAANLMTNANGLSAALAREIYAHPALVPASPWLDNKPPGHPALRLENGAKSRELSASWTSTSQEPVRLWLLQARINGKWTSEIMPGHQLSRAWPSGGLDSLPDMLSLAAVDRCGNLGAATVVETKAYRRSTAVK